MSRYPEIPLGRVLTLDMQQETVDPDKIYNMAGIYSYGRGLFERPPIGGTETSYSKYTKLRAGQFVYSKLFGWEGAAAVVPDEFDGKYVSHEFPTFTINPSLAYTPYLGLLAQWNGLHAKLKDKGTGVGSRRQRVNISRLLGTTVPLPDLAEQRRIAARLDAVLNKVSRVTKLQAHRDDLRGALRESAISTACSEATNRVQVKDILKLERRPVFPEADEVYREIGVKSFGRGIFHKDPTTTDELGDKRVFAIRPGDLVFSNVFAWEGAVALATEKEAGMIGSHRFMTYRVNAAIADATYLKQYFTSSQGLEIIRHSSPGSAGRNKTLGIKSFDQQWLQLPSLDVQQRIGRSLVASSTPAMDKDRALVSSLRLALLDAAFTGKL